MPKAGNVKPSREEDCKREKDPKCKESNAGIANSEQTKLRADGRGPGINLSRTSIEGSEFETPNIKKLKSEPAKLLTLRNKPRCRKSDANVPDPMHERLRSSEESSRV